MGKRFLIDSNIIVHFLAASYDEKALNLLEEILIEGFSISFTTQIELLAYKNASSLEMAMRQQIIDLANVIHIDDEIIDKTIDIRKQKACKIPDAIIAATSITQNYTLISENDKDFTQIQNIQYLNPRQLS